VRACLPLQDRRGANQIHEQNSERLHRLKTKTKRKNDFGSSHHLQIKGSKYKQLKSVLACN
jgi:hypothetical protein